MQWEWMNEWMNQFKRKLSKIFCDCAELFRKYNNNLVHETNCCVISWFYGNEEKKLHTHNVKYYIEWVRWRVHSEVYTWT